jgi:(2Fe-2S) ferredoxin
MKPIDVSQCETHVLVCTNEKPDNRECCGKFGGKEFFFKLKEKVKQEGLAGTIWVTRTGCLGFCNPVGTTVKIQNSRNPGQTKWYNEVKESDFPSIWNQIIGMNP